MDKKAKKKNEMKMGKIKELNNKNCRENFDTSI